MTKKKSSRTTHVLKRVFNVRSWLDWVRVKGWAIYFIQAVKKFFVPQPSQPGESFAAAMVKYHLTEEDVQSRQRSLQRLSHLMFGIAVLIFIYSVYHLYLFNFLAFLLSFIVMSIALVLAFRYHFWSFQLKQRKLGCTLQEWYNQGLMGKKR
tara:strand:- start:251 stop:706 length:456 start_codon:yes stop_codon:yes gene_type:complete